MERLNSELLSPMYLMSLLIPSTSVIPDVHNRHYSSEELHKLRTLTHRRRSFVFKQETISLSTQLVMNRAKRKLRGVLVWRSILKNFTVYGVSPKITAKGKYRRSIVSALTRRNLSVVYQIPEQRPDLGCLFSPDSKFKQIWSLVMLCLLFYVFLATPWILAFEEVEVWSFLFTIELTVDILFFCDILITLNSAYKDREGIQVNRYVIFKNYLTGLLLVDLLAIFPFYLIEENEANSNSLVRIIRITKVSRVLRASKLLKVFKILSNIDWMEQCIKAIQEHDGLARLLLASIIVLIMGHIVACMWYLTANIDDFGPDTWVVRCNFQNASKGELYLVSMYWAFATLTTVGFGDIAAYTTGELVLSILWMVFGIGFYSFLVGTLTSVLSSIDTRDSNVKSQIDLIEKFGYFYDLSAEIVKKMKQEAVENPKARTMKSNKRLKLLGLLSSRLKFKVCMNMHNGALQRIPFLRGQDRVFITNIVPRLEMVIFGGDKNIYYKGDHAESMYFIAKGRVSFIVSFGFEDYSFKSMIQGGHFGEAELIERSPRLYSVYPDNYCELLVMTQMLYIEICYNYEKVAFELHRIAKEKTKRDFQALKETIDLVEVNFSNRNHLTALAGQVKLREKESLLTQTDSTGLLLELQQIKHQIGEVVSIADLLVGDDIAKSINIRPMEDIYKNLKR